MTLLRDATPPALAGVEAQLSKMWAITEGALRGSPAAEAPPRCHGGSSVIRE
jgi:hypothetical protein